MGEDMGDKNSKNIIPPKKGEVRNKKGRVKGVPNKATTEFKEAVKNLIDYATPEMVGWLQQIAETDPYKALEMVYKFAQFGHPLLARSELTGANGGAINHNVALAPSDAEILERYMKGNK